MVKGGWLSLGGLNHLLSHIYQPSTLIRLCSSSEGSCCTEVALGYYLDT